MGITIKGVVAFQIPASTEEICVSPYENNVNGAAMPTTATTALSAHSETSRGHRCRVTASRTTSTIAPLRTRPSAT